MTWSASEYIAGQINKIRKRAGLNREQLAEKCRQAGASSSLTAAVVANIETGRRGPDGRRRRDVTVDELVIFAKALDVSPLLLVYPLDDERQALVEVLPGREIPLWIAAKWFAGEGPLAVREPEGGWGVDTDEFEEWQRNNAPLDLRREHDRLTAKWDEAKRDAGWYREAAETAATAAQRESTLAAADVMENEARNAEVALREVRREMTRRGLPTPELGDELRHVDEGGRR